GGDDATPSGHRRNHPRGSGRGRSAEKFASFEGRRATLPDGALRRIRGIKRVREEAGGGGAEGGTTAPSPNASSKRIKASGD
ncbi:unnamed protein product, partial [Discosporangium mesarthrocarpum]